MCCTMVNSEGFPTVCLSEKTERDVRCTATTVLDYLEKLYCEAFYKILKSLCNFSAFTLVFK